MTALQKPPKHKGHEGTRRKSLHLQTFVYVVSACPRFVGVVFKDLFAVDSFMQGAVKMEAGICSCCKFRLRFDYFLGSFDGSVGGSGGWKGLKSVSANDEPLGILIVPKVAS